VSAVPAEVAALVERFARNRDAYHSPGYNEAQTRQEFIDPLFRALGWDVDNISGLAEAYKDVIHEDAIKVGGASKAPDYCFRIGGTRKFFVEAKKPAVGLETDPEPAYQLRRYAWTSKLPLSILTDFEEFAVYDCRIPPKVGDKASVARVFYGTCDQYAEHWDFIAGLFSKDAVLKGAFDKYAESNKRKKGTAEVDAEFLKQIESWRLALAQNLALRNPQLSVRDLNFAVQRTIDRIIFLRMCEDRGVEIYGGLQALLNGEQVYERLAVLFRRADEKYNSGLFYFTAEAGREPPDTFTLGLTLDDRVLKDILKSLYYPESPYEFSVLPPEVLGQVYEQFLGKVIRLTAGHHAKVEEKPEVRKAGGVYYTPAYIVDYIVKNTVGKLLAERVPGLGTRGPELGARDQGLGARGQGDKAYGDQTLSRPGGVAEGDGPRGTGLPDRQNAAGGGTLRTDQPDSAGGGVDTRERGGGAWPDASGRLPPSSLDSARLAGGTGNAPDVGGPPRSAEPGGGPPDLGTVPARRPTPERAHRRPAKKGARVPKPGHPGPIPGPLRVLDPACGSGSFLLGAYQYLLNWHRDWYVSGLGTRGSGLGVAAGASFPSPQSRVPGPDFPDRLYQGPGGQWLLTIQEKKRILLNHIYGVDIDPQAVETTKLSLLLKVLEGETEQTIGSNLRLFHERALPDLDKNIKCGNSLIGPDFYDIQQMTMFDEDERLRINAFDWAAEFPEVFRGPGSGSRVPGSGSQAPSPDPGFDGVIGNPPWGGDIDRALTYFHRVYPAATKEHTDSFKLFVARTAQLTRSAGLAGMILPNALVRQRRYKDIRQLVLKGAILVVTDLGEDVFPGVVAPSCVLIWAPNSESHVPWAYTDLRSASDLPSFLSEATGRARAVSHSDATADPDVSLAAAAPIASTERLARLGDVPQLKCKDAGINYQRVGVGMEVKGNSDLGGRLLYEGARERPDHEMFWKGSDIGRYCMTPSTNRFCRVECAQQLRNNEVVRLARQVYTFTPKILLRQTADRPIATLDTRGVWFGRSILAILPSQPIEQDIRYFLGLLNSRYLTHVYQQITAEAGRVFAQVKFAKLKQLPVRTLDLTREADRQEHDRLVALVQQMLDLHKELAAAKTPATQTALQRQIDATDRQIDRLVYELYGLTGDEITTLEGSPQ
jgi:hypothetical protein